MRELIEKLGINPLLLGAQVVNFLILLFVLKKFLYQPLIKLLDNRSKKIGESLKRAEEIEKSAVTTQQEFDKQMKDAQQKSRALIAQAKEEAENIKTDLVQKAEEQTHELLERGQKTLESERENIIRELRSEAANLVVQATSKILEEELDDAKKQEIAQKVTKEIS